MKTNGLLASLLASLFVIPAGAFADDGVCTSADGSTVVELVSAVRTAASIVPPPAARMIFDGAYGERVEDIAGGPGHVYKGGLVQLAIDPARFENCAGGKITAYVKDLTGAVTAVPMDSPWNGLATGNIAVGHSGLTQIWFKTERPAYENVSACTEWDSDYGRNYGFNARNFDPAHATFAAGAWAPSFDKAVVPGGSFVVESDESRLPNCRPSYMGNPTWSILAHVRFDDGREVVKPVAGRVPTVGGPQAFSVPDDATGAKVWFENVGYYPGNDGPVCRDWDSRYGANYDVAISN